MRRDEAEEVIKAMEHHEKEAPGLTLAQDEFRRATSSDHNAITLGSVGKLKGFLGQIDYFGVDPKTYSGVIDVQPFGDKRDDHMVVMDIGKLWKAKNPDAVDTAPARRAQVNEIFASKEQPKEK